MMGCRIKGAAPIRGPLLFILDNFEQIDATGAEAVSQWIAAAPDLHLLVTSRVPLGTPIEKVLRLGPLDESAAADLFASRALEVAPEFDAHGQRASTVELVRQLECHPLSLELAAARTRAFSPVQISERLREPLSMLRDPVGSDSRHASLDRALRWSWSLLSPQEQLAWAQATTFVSTFSVDDAEQVLDLGSGTREVWEVLERLVDFSVLQPIDLPGARCLRLPVTARAFGLARLSELDPERAAIQRHDHWVVSRFGRQDSFTSRPKSAAHSQRTLRYLDEISSATVRAIAAGDGEKALLLVNGHRTLGHGAVDPFSFIPVLRSILELPNIPLQSRIILYCELSALLTLPQKLDEAFDAASQAIALADAQGGAPFAAAAMAMAQVTSTRDSELALKWLQTALAHWDHSTPYADRRAQRLLAVIHVYRGDTRAAEQASEKAIAGFRRYGESFELTRALADRGSLLLQNGWLDQARRAFEDAIAEYVNWPGDFGSVASYGNLGATYQQLGDYPRAEVQFRKCVQLCQQFGVPHAATHAHASLGTLYADMGRLDQARHEYGLALDRVETSGDVRLHAFALAMLADLDRRVGALSQARAGLHRASALTQGRFRHIEIVILCNKGQLHLDEGQEESGRTCHQRAKALLAEAGVHPRSRFAEMVQDLGTRLNPDP